MSEKSPPETDPFTFMGHSALFWNELARKADSLDVVDLLEENAKLRGRVAFYEHHIGRMNSLKERP